MDYLDLVKTRRSNYNILNSLGDNTEEDIINLVETVTKHCPTPYNIQSNRAYILFGDKHRLFWDLVKEVLLEKIGEERFKKTKEKIESQFQSGYGTILIYEDTNVVDDYVEEFGQVAKSFVPQASGHYQAQIWLGLKSMNLGSSLQHYNPIVDERVYEALGVQRHHRLIAQIPFGAYETEPDQKEFKNPEKMVKVLR